MSSRCDNRTRTKVANMPDKANEQEFVRKTTGDRDDACDPQVEPVVSENTGIVDQVHRMVTDIAVLEELLSVLDPVGKLRAFSDSLDGDERLVKLKSRALGSSPAMWCKRSSSC